jgi:hypothetical protein
MIKHYLRKLIRILRKIRIHFIKKLSISKLNKLEIGNLPAVIAKPATIDIIIFTKDRPMQLLALLESLKCYSSKYIAPHIIYNCKNSLYQEAYKELFSKHSDLYAGIYNDNIKGFKSSLIELLNNLKSDQVTFFVDDIMIKENINWDDFLKFDTTKTVPSLRMGTNLKRCYTANDTQILPPLRKFEHFNFWYWSEGEHDWNYPISLDGNIFSRTEFLSMINELDFKAPNTLELKLRKYRNKFLNRLGICYDFSPIVNNPINKVQSEINNLYGNIHQDELLTFWTQGKRIDYLAYKGFENISCHQELELIYRK